MERTCPNCQKHYITILDRPPLDDRNIQQIFPNAPAYQREQLITGLCSDKCWDEFLGIEVEETPKGKELKNG